MPERERVGAPVVEVVVQAPAVLLGAQAAVHAPLLPPHGAPGASGHLDEHLQQVDGAEGGEAHLGARIARAVPGGSYGLPGLKGNSMSTMGLPAPGCP